MAEIMGRSFFRSAVFVLTLTIRGVAFGGEDPSIACFNAMADNPSLAPLQGKIVLKIGDHPGLSMLSDDRRPTKREKEAIEVWGREAQRCFDTGHDYRAGAYTPVVATLIDESMHSLDVLAAELYAGKLTYGQFNQQRQANDDAFQERIARAYQTSHDDLRRDQQNKAAQQAMIDAQKRAADAQEEALREQREAQEQAEEDRRREAVSDALNNLQKSLTPPPPIPQPVNCISQRLGGGMVATNCN